ncbi:MAG TPA: YCF48-related protein, partial [Chthoniobacterales bacterium]|nr:YCF48-related protein [Chthoniobacterales bacterium]
QTLAALCGVGTELWIVGTDGTILYSADGGQTWQPQVSGTAHHLLDVFSIGSQLWSVGYGGAILHSVDGGRNWQRQTAESLPSG